MSTVDEQFLAHSRLLRPFPVRKLADTLHHVQADAHAINDLLLKLQTDPPRLPEEWAEELERLALLLESLAARCDDVQPTLAMMVDQADADWRRALNGLVATIRGLQQQAEAQAA